MASIRTANVAIAFAASDGGWLCEASSVDGGGGGTTAGWSMVIDYLLTAAVGLAAPLATAPVRVVPRADVVKASDPANGLRDAVLTTGSDHLPVACEIVVG